MRIGRQQRGDTIIEVLFAITIFSLIAVGGLSLMNQGTALAQQALEISLVRQQIDTQADALRYINKEYVADYGQDGPASALWRHIVSNNVPAADSFDTIATATTCNLPGASGQPFALDVEKIDTKLITSPPTIEVEFDPVLRPTNDTVTYSKIRYGDDNRASAEGIWIQAVPSATKIVDGTTRPGFYDFHIRACWHSPGRSTPIVSGTIVRLYEPRG